MTRDMILPLLTATLLAVACKNQQANSRDDGGTASSNGGTQDSRQLGGPQPGDSLVISLERTPCFGMCPAYRFNVYRSGFATYEGVVHVEQLGRHEARIPVDRIERAVARAKELGFFQFDDVYDSQVTDLPSTIIRVSASGRSKQVLGRVGAPPGFKTLTSYLEEELLPAAWRPVPADH
ncbi:MAG: hypothetical protein KIT10_15130 [Flavobacteriales bacterium]|nr:hypothetical protein [Flavobacteriales bacterium]